jgi:hypothetical protein
MASFVRVLALALIAAGSCAGLSAPASAGGCVGLSGTADGFDKETAVSRAQLALTDYIKQYQAAKHLSSVTVTAQRATPQPYWRPYVSDNMYYHPDIVNAKSYTICWQGVVSPYVCTSGAKMCW